MSTVLNPLSIDAELAERLERDNAFRARYLRKWAQIQVASGIKTLRRKRGKRQAELAAVTGTGQSAISRIEKADYDGWTFKTLLNIAEKLDAQLDISFRPIEDVIAGFRTQSSISELSEIFEVGNTNKKAHVVRRDIDEQINLFVNDDSTGRDVEVILIQ